MTSTEFRRILEEVLEEVLAEMAEEGPPPSAGRLEDFPSTWDVNNGWCARFGHRVEDRCPEAAGSWCEGTNELYGREISHYILQFGALYYDAECLDGVEEVDDLPIYRNVGRSREEVLAEREAMRASLSA